MEKKEKEWETVVPLRGKKEDCGCEWDSMGKVVKRCEKHKEKHTDVSGGPKRDDQGRTAT